MAKSILGIDVGSDVLKIALVKGKTIKKTATAAMPANMMRDGRIVSPEILSELIRNTMRKNGMHCSRAAVALANEVVFVRNVTVPRMTADQLTYNLPFEFRDYITEELKDYVYDYAMFSSKKDILADGERRAAEDDAGSLEEPENGAAMDLLAVAVPVEVLEEYKGMLRKAGLKLMKAAPTVCSYMGLIRQVERINRPSNGEYCILDLGYQAIRMYMFKGDRHQVTRALEIGLNQIDTVIADAYNVDVHLAHTYLLTNFDDCQNREFCVNAFNNVVVELMRALNFYRFSNPDSELSDIWLCGGGAAIESLRTAIQSGLDMLVHPAEELLPNGGAVNEAYTMVQAIGITQE